MVYYGLSLSILFILKQLGQLQTVANFNLNIACLLNYIKVNIFIYIIVFFGANMKYDSIMV